MKWKMKQEKVVKSRYNIGQYADAFDKLALASPILRLITSAAFPGKQKIEYQMTRVGVLSWDVEMIHPAIGHNKRVQFRALWPRMCNDKTIVWLERVVEDWRWDGTHDGWDLKWRGTTEQAVTRELTGEKEEEKQPYYSSVSSGTSTMVNISNQMMQQQLQNVKPGSIINGAIGGTFGTP